MLIKTFRPFGRGVGSGVGSRKFAAFDFGDGRGGGSKPGVKRVVFMQYPAMGFNSTETSLGAEVEDIRRNELYETGH